MKFLSSLAWSNYTCDMLSFSRAAESLLFLHSQVDLVDVLMNSTSLLQDGKEITNLILTFRLGSLNQRFGTARRIEKVFVRPCFSVTVNCTHQDVVAVETTCSWEILTFKTMFLGIYFLLHSLNKNIQHCIVL